MAGAPRQQRGLDPFAPAGQPAHIVGMDTATRLAISVNGEEYGFDAPLSVALLLERLGLDARKVAVERNRVIVRRARYGETWLEAGDAVEIVHFIGGG